MQCDDMYVLVVGGEEIQTLEVMFSLDSVYFIQYYIHFFILVFPRSILVLSMMVPPYQYQYHTVVCSCIIIRTTTYLLYEYIGSSNKIVYVHNTA